ncbi:MAG: hypothetical protein FK730_14150 [Asgard group archaeon]|nr:hypothetical protein [Asgard group archaeon]
MNFRTSRKILALSFLALLIPVLIIPASSETGSVFSFNNFSSSSSDSYVEDFTTTTYKDVLSTATGWGTGALTSTRNFSASILDLLPTPNPIVDIDVQGRKVYAAIHAETPGIDSVGAFLINDPTNIIYTGGDNSWYYTKAVEANGDFLYAGQMAMFYSVVVHDLSNPYVPSSANGWGFLDGFVTDIETNGYLIYFTNYNATSGYSLKILYAEDPMNLELITCDWASSKALGLAVQGEMVYVAAGDEGFYVLNASNKYSPVELDHFPLPGNCTDVIVDGNFAYVACGDEGVYALDVRDPSNIFATGLYDSPGNAIDLVKQGNTLFVADGTGGVQVLDVANPYHPTFVTALMMSYVYCVDLYGGILVVGAENGLHTISIQAGEGINYLEEAAYENPFSNTQVYDIRVQGNIAYIAGGTDGLITVDVSDPDNPILLGQHAEGGSPFYRKLDIQGNYAYVADYGNGVRSYDISDPTNPIYLDYLFYSYATDVCCYGEVVVVADGTLGVYFMNVTDPADIPSAFANFGGINNVTSLDIQGHLLYLVTEASADVCFLVYDISDLSSPTPLYWWTPHSTAFYDIYVDGDQAYTADMFGFVVNWDVVTPSAPFYTDAFALGIPTGIWGFGPYMLVADQFFGAFLFDARNTASLAVHSAYIDIPYARQITTHGDFTYVANKTHMTILRHFLSAGDTYIPGSAFGLSLEVDSMAYGEIKSATLNAIDFVPPGTQIDYYMTADGGAHWEAVTPGLLHEFVNTGDDLRWEADFLGPEHRSAHIYQIIIDYEFNEAPSIPTLADLGDKALGTFKVDWSDSTDDVAVDHYILQMSDSLSFTTIVKEWTTTKSSQTVFLGKGTFYFRVQAVDDEGFPSPWSIVKQADTKLSTTIFGVILGGGLIVVILAIVIPLVLIRRKKKVPTR